MVRFFSLLYLLLIVALPLVFIFCYIIVLSAVQLFSVKRYNLAAA